MMKSLRPRMNPSLTLTPHLCLTHNLFEFPCASKLELDDQTLASICSQFEKDYSYQGYWPADWDVQNKTVEEVHNYFTTRANYEDNGFADLECYLKPVRSLTSDMRVPYFNGRLLDRASCTSTTSALVLLVVHQYYSTSTTAVASSPREVGMTF
eukprot:Lankesteria_metandrocarpae@DN5405_c0_g2_i1.p1